MLHVLSTININVRNIIFIDIDLIMLSEYLYKCHRCVCSLGLKSQYEVNGCHILKLKYTLHVVNTGAKYVVLCDVD